MSIPKKRRKLDESINPKVELDSVPNLSREKVAKSKKTTKAKLDSAFDVIDKVEKNITDKTIEVKKVDSLAQYNSSDGIHIKFKIDFIHWQDFVDGARKRTKEEDEGLVVDFTIPYPWNLPIIGDLTKNILRELAKFKIL